MNTNPAEYTTDNDGNPPGILLRGIDKLEERLTIIYPNGRDKDPAYIIVRWENKNKVWVVNNVFTLPRETALALKNYIIE